MAIDVGDSVEIRRPAAEVFEPGSRLAWEGPPIPMGPGLGSLEPSGEYDLEERDGATQVTMRMHPKTAGLMSLFAPLMSRSMRKEASENVQRLKRKLEGNGG